MYPHTSRVLLQSRDLTCWLLVALGVTRLKDGGLGLGLGGGGGSGGGGGARGSGGGAVTKAELLGLVTHLMEYAAASVRHRHAAFVGLLKDLRMHSVDALKQLVQWRAVLRPTTSSSSAGGGNGGRGGSHGDGEDDSSYTAAARPAAAPEPR